MIMTKQHENSADTPTPHLHRLVKLQQHRDIDAGALLRQRTAAIGVGLFFSFLFHPKP